MKPKSFFKSFSFKSVLIGTIIGICLGVYVCDNLHEAYYYGEDGKTLYKALHIFLPGNTTIYSPEHEVNLRNWVGTTMKGFEEESPEKAAGLTLLKTPIFSESEGYELKQKNDGHWVLYKPEKTRKEFSLKARYRIWRGKKVQS